MQQVILSDENCGKHAEIIFHALDRLDYVDFLGLVLKKFNAVGLAMDTDNETVWRFCQEKGYPTGMLRNLLLTGNRSAKDCSVSLELTVRRLVTKTSLPVLTIGDLERVLTDREYCERCAERLGEIVFDLEGYRGVTRLTGSAPPAPTTRSHLAWLHRRASERGDELNKLHLIP